MLVDITFLLAVLLLAFGVTAFLIPVLRNHAVRRNWVDRPDAIRKLHAQPIPTVGGFAIAAGFAAGIAALYVLSQYFTLPFPKLPGLVWVGGGIIVATGFVDDLKGISFKTKFLVQIIAAYMLLHAGLRIELNSLPFVNLSPLQESLYSFPLTLIWIVGVINAVNLIDGIDGLAGGVSLIAFTALAVLFGLTGNITLATLAVPIAGALLAFLIFNFNPASIFMGDTGSLFLGYMLAVFSLSGKTSVDPVLATILPIAVLGLPILDTTLAMGRRFVHKKAICAPDRDHIHHRLSQLFSVRVAVLCLYAVALGFSGLAVIAATVALPYAYLVVGIMAILATALVGTLGYFQPSAPPEPAPVVKPQPDLRLAGHGDGSGRREPALSPAPQSEIVVTLSGRQIGGSTLN